MSPRGVSKWIIGVWILLAILGSRLGSAFETHDLKKSLSLGYDAFGRNCFLLLPSATLELLRSAGPAAALCIVLALGLASLAAPQNARVREIIRALFDTLSALPGFLIALALGVLLPGSRLTFYLATSFLVLPSTLRYFEGQLLKLQSEDYIAASRALGGSSFHLWSCHYFPFLTDATRSIFPFVFTRVILLESSLSFLGLTPTPDHETWGRLLLQGKDYLIEAPWILGIFGAAFCSLIAAFHLLSREDPH